MHFTTPASQHGSAVADRRIPTSAQNARVATERERHVVIVDSYDDCREFYEQWFTFAGLRATGYATAAAAREAIARDLPDAVITSLRLQGEDAFGFCELLKRRARTAATPLIALASCMSDFDRAREGGTFAAILMIPCPPDALLAVLKRVLAACPRRAVHALA